MSNDPISPRPSPALADLFVPERTEEIAFWSALALGYGRVAVNWHCGTGELAIGMARRGMRVLGVDPNPDAIDVARARENSGEPTPPAPGDDNGVMLTWLCHEPRLVSLPGPADFSVLSNLTLGAYLVEEQRIGLLHNLYDYLRPGGALGLTVPMKPVPPPAAGRSSTKSISGPLRKLPKGFFARRVSTLDYDVARSLLTGHDDLMLRLPDGEQHFEESYTRRLFSPEEIFQILRDVGFVAIGMWGGWDRRPLRQANGWFVVRAERPLHRPVGKQPQQTPASLPQ